MRAIDIAQYYNDHVMCAMLIGGGAQLVNTSVTAGTIDSNLVLISKQIASSNITLHECARFNLVGLAEERLNMGVYIDDVDSSGNTALHWACDEGHVDVITLLLQHNANLDIINDKGRTALHNCQGKPWYSLVAGSLTVKFNHAIHSSDGTSIEYLHSIGMEYDRDGNHMLVEVVRYASEDLIVMLLSRGVYVDSVNSDGSTSLMWAAYLGYEEKARILLDAMANAKLQDYKGYNACWYQISGGHVCIAKLFREYGILMEWSEGVPRSPKKKRTFKECMEDVTMWNGSDRQKRSRHFQHAPMTKSLNPGAILSPECQLHAWICQYNRVHCPDIALRILQQLFLICQCLIDVAAVNVPESFLAGLKVIAALDDDLVNTKHPTTHDRLLHLISKLNHVKAMQLLLTSQCIDVNAQDGKKCTAIVIVAMTHQDQNIVIQLLRRGANAFLVNEDGCNALNYAAKAMKKSLLHLLSKEKNYDIGVMQSACEYSREELSRIEWKDSRIDFVSDLLSEGKFKIDDTDDHGDTLLMYCCRNSLTKIISLLLQWGADPEILNKYQQSALILSDKKTWWAEISCKAYSKLWSAIMVDNKAEIQRLIMVGANLNLPNIEGEYAICFAVKYASDVTVDFLLKMKASVQVGNENNETPLLIASALGRASLIPRIIEFGASILSRDSKQNTFLHLLAAEDCASALKFAVSKYHDHSTHWRDCFVAVNSEGDTPIMTAIRLNKVSSVNILSLIDTIDQETLLALKGITDNRCLHTILGRSAIERLYEACKFGLTCLVKAYCIDCGVQNLMNERLFVSEYCIVNNACKEIITNETCLFVACLFGHFEIVSELLIRGASPNIISHHGWTCLLVTTKKNNVDIALLLIRYGADVNGQSRNGVTALHLAAFNGNCALVHLLLTSGADVNLCDLLGTTALLAAVYGRKRSVGLPGYSLVLDKLLCCKSIDVEAINAFGRSVFHETAGSDWYSRISSKISAKFTRAIKTSNSDMIKHLHSIGMEYDCEGNHMLVEAANYSSDAVFEMMLSLGVNVNSTNRDGTSALMAVSKLGFLNILQMLVERNADKDLKDSKGLTAMEHARRESRLNVLAKLAAYIPQPNTSVQKDNAPMDTSYLPFEYEVELGSDPDCIVCRTVEYCEYCIEEELIYRGIVNPSLGSLLSEHLKFQCHTTALKLVAGLHVFCLGCLESHVYDPDDFLPVVQVLSIWHDATVVNRRHPISGASLLHQLCAMGHVEALSLILLNPYLDVDALNNEQCSSLHIAIQKHQSMEVVALLLKRNSNPLKCDGNGSHALDYALRSEKNHLLFLLQAHLYDCDDYTPKMVQDWFKSHFSFTLFDINEMVCGNTIQMIVCRYGLSKIVKLTISLGANPEIVNPNGESALILSIGRSWWNDIRCDCYRKLGVAIVRNNVEEIGRLVAAGVNLNEVWEGHVALFLAITNATVDTIARLIELGADVNARCQGESALMHASFMGFQSAIVLLIKSGADYLEVDDTGNTILHVLAGRNHHEALIGCGHCIHQRNSGALKFLVNIRNSYGLTASDCAVAETTRTFLGIVETEQDLTYFLEKEANVKPTSCFSTYFPSICSGDDLSSLSGSSGESQSSGELVGKSECFNNVF